MDQNDWDKGAVRTLHEDLVSLHGEVDRESKHGAPGDSQPGQGVRQLLTTILSQNVADRNTRRAKQKLFDRYDDFSTIEHADHDELADVIRVAGLSDQKASRIQRALKAIRQETGGAYSLAFLDALPADEARSWLTKIKGIGPKTASVVLNFHFGKPTMAVDTHVERVSKRFGMVPESATNKRAHKVLDGIVPDNLTYSLHVLLITHGRQYCKARNPNHDNHVCRTYHQDDVP